MKSGDKSGAALQRALQPTADCLPIERFAETWTAAEGEHVNGCPRCQTEIALWRQFETSATTDEEEHAVRQIAAALRQQAVHAAAPKRLWRWRSGPAMAAMAASVAFIALIGYSVWDPEPKLGVVRHDTATVYRTVHVQPVAPIGDVASPPRSLEWTAVDGAARYHVQLLEVDRTVVWRATTTSPHVDLPAEIVARLVPGKTVLWTVAAENAAGDAVADSGVQPFRVTRDGAPLRGR